MKELKCPKCGTSFAIDEADYASILIQVRNAEFEEALQIRIEETIAQHKAELVVTKANSDKEYAEKLAEKAIEASKKDSEIARLNEQLNSLMRSKDLEIKNELAK